MSMSRFFRLPFFSYSTIIIFLIIFRLINLDNIPLFLDEAYNLYLADVIRNNPEKILLSIDSNIMPIQIWFLSILNFIFYPYADMLVVGRIFTVVCAFISVFFIYKIGSSLFSKDVGIFAIIIYLSLPLNFLHSRLILLETTTSSFFLAALYTTASLLTSRNFQKKLYQKALLIILLLVLAFFTKPIVLTALPSIFILMYLSYRSQRSKASLYKLRNFLFFFSLLILGVLFISSLLIHQKYIDYYIHPLNFYEFLENFKHNLWKSAWWLNSYFTIWVLLGLVLFFIYSFFSKNYKLIFLTLWFAAIILISALVSANFFPRHLYFLAAPTSLMVGFLIFRLKSINKITAFVALVLLMIPLLKIDFKIIQNPETAPIALEDRSQLYQDQSSGKGLREVATKLKELGKDKEIVIVNDDDPFINWSLPRLYQVNPFRIHYVEDIDNIELHLFTFSQMYPGKPIYVVINRHMDLHLRFPSSLVYSFSKNDHRSISIYKYNR